MPRSGTTHRRLARRRYRSHIVRFHCQRPKFVDESGLDIAMTRAYGRAMRGRHMPNAAPKNFGRNLTVLGALSWYGLNAVMTIECATDAEVFRVYVKRVLAPSLRPGNVVVMDNLAANKVAGIKAAFLHARAQLVYLSPYTPDWSPIERCWSALKARLRGIKMRTRQALYRLLHTVSN